MEYNLKKNSWHTKLMKTIWGYNHTDFPNMCPYFWLTLFNILLVIVGYVPYLVFTKLIRPIIEGISEVNYKIKEYCRTREKNWIDNFVDKLLANDFKAFEELETDSKTLAKVKWDSKVLYYARYTQCNRKDLKGFDSEMLDKIFSLRESFKKWDAMKAEKLHKRELFLAEQRSREQILKDEAIARRKRIGEITVKLKFLFKTLGGIIVVAALSGIMFLFYKLGLILSVLNWAVIGKHIGIVLAALALVFSIGGAIYLLAKLMVFLGCKYGKYCVPCSDRRKKLNNFFKWLFVDNLVVSSLFNVFIAIGKGMKEIGLIKD